MTLLRVDASIRTDGSHSRELADVVEQEWRQTHPGDAVERRQLGVDVLPADAWGHAVAGSYVAAADRSPEQSAALALAAELVAELRPPTPSCWRCRCTTSASPSTSRPGST